VSIIYFLNNVFLYINLEDDGTQSIKCIFHNIIYYNVLYFYVSRASELKSWLMAMIILSIVYLYNTSFIYLFNLYSLHYEAVLLFISYHNYIYYICVYIYIYEVPICNRSAERNTCILHTAQVYLFYRYVENITFQVTSCYDYFNDLL